MLTIFDNKNRRCAAGFILALLSTTAVQAFEFGAMQVASGLGQPLQATVAINGARASVQMSTCFTSHVNSQSGVLMASADITIMPAENGALLRLSTAERIAEPAVKLIVQSRCGYNIRREFALLLDPPITEFSVPAGMTPTLGTLALPGPTPTARRGPREEDRLRRFIAARQASLPTNARQSTQKRDVPLRQNALYLTTPTAMSMTALLDEPRKTNAEFDHTANLRLTLADRIMVRNPPPLAAASPQDGTALTISPTTKLIQKLLTVLGGALVVGLGLIVYFRMLPVFRKPPPLDWRWEEDEKIASVDHTHLTPASPMLASMLPAFALPAAVPLATPTAPTLMLDPMVPGPMITSPMVTGPIYRYDSVPVFAPTMKFMPEVSSPIVYEAAPELPALQDLQFPELPVTSNALEEISDVMEEAEFWISLKDMRRAVEVLEPYASAAQPGGPLPWLYLFDLYLEMESRDKYDALRETFHRIFNARILTWDDQIRAGNNLPEQSIEDMPHLKAKITSLWNSREIIPYLQGLLIDDRYGTRAGFTLPIFHDIMFLITLATAMHREKRIDDKVMV